MHSDFYILPIAVPEFKISELIFETNDLTLSSFKVTSLTVQLVSCAHVSQQTGGDIV